ncbi:pimeloyl-ACP methyl ester carboxylesterase [Ancylomarina subtilis]|uniref:Pimeloyl-ACP methyl ester carboxylesterase n=1 Tax=Ancylomarina subtilis TaxID=1639035 RepID=A0A4Q7V709_9BACT|nr:alpha/beta hydrolase [Ancylomarina subtilis]RZT92411.1 pimeloyl-ACP methyl ester carboxylesterase [Ancylomarina subtilis]
MKKITTTITLLVLFSLSVSANLQSIQVEVKGKGKPVLLLPGFTCTGDVWNETVAEISETNECHIVTYAGFGNVPALDTLWLQTIKQDLDMYIEQNKFEDLSIIGHSMGGTLALWLASDKKHDIKNLLVVDALPCMGALMIPNYSSETITYDTPYARNLLSMSDSDFSGMAMNFAKFMCKNTSKHEQIANWIKISDRKTYVHGYFDLLKIDLRKSLSKIDIPVRILAAANPSKSMVENAYNEQYALLDNKDVIYIENSAHFIMYDQYDVYIENVKQILE